jgi:hypothetical protein
MGRKVLEFVRLYPNPKPGFVTAVARLQELLARADQLARQQLDGLSEVHAATTRKRELRRLLRSAHLDHLVNVARIAAVEDSEVLQKFALPVDATSYLAFQAAANGMAAEAESRKDLLMKHGLSEEVLTGLKTILGEFQSAVDQSSGGRLAHVGASADLLAVADEIVRVVRMMNGVVRIAFAHQPDILAAWESASSVFATPRAEKPEPEETPVPGGTPPAGDEIRPAA